MRTLLSALCNLVLVLLAPVSGLAGDAVKTITFLHGGVEYSAAIHGATDASKKTGIVLFHECWGQGELETRHAKMLAAKGYVVMVADLFGKGVSTKSFAKAGALIEAAEGESMKPLYGLVAKTIEQFRRNAAVSTERPLIGIGFGFGAGILLNAIKSGDESFGAAVLFYGGVEKIEKSRADAKKIPLLYLRPENDAYTTDEAFTAFTQEFAESAWDLSVLKLANANHGFVQKGIEAYGKDEGETFMTYDAKAAEKAWARVLEFIGKR